MHELSLRVFCLLATYQFDYIMMHVVAFKLMRHATSIVQGSSLAIMIIYTSQYHNIMVGYQLEKGFHLFGNSS